MRAGGSWRCPGARAPLVTYRLTESDMSRLARGLVHLGEVLLAAGATELYPSVADGRVVRRTDELVAWWDAVTRRRTNLMTVHMTSTVRMGEDAGPHRRRQLRPGVGLPEPARQRRLAPARRARREPAVGDDGDRGPQRRALPLGVLTPGAAPELNLVAPAPE